eukprot:IDg19990t1
MRALSSTPRRASQTVLRYLKSSLSAIACFTASTKRYAFRAQARKGKSQAAKACRTVRTSQEIRDARGGGNEVGR